MDILNKQAVLDLTKPSSGGSGGSTDYPDLTHKPQVNGNTLVGNKTSAQLGLVGDVQFNGTTVVTSGVANITDTNIRAVSPACTTLSGITATITANTTYAHAVGSSGCTYTLTTPSTTNVYSGFILMLDTTSSATIAFQTDGSPATSIVISGSPTIETGKAYTVVGQYNVLSSAWNIWISEYKGA